MTPYLLTPAAELDIESIGLSIALDSADVSERVLNEIRSAMRRLAEFPRIGTARQDLGASDLRTWGVYSYIIVYHASTRPIEIVRVIHGARELADAFGVSITTEKSPRTRSRRAK